MVGIIIVERRPGIIFVPSGASRCGIERNSASDPRDAGREPSVRTAAGARVLSSDFPSISPNGFVGRPLTSS